MERGTPEQRVNRKRKNKTFKIVVLWMMILSAIWLPCGCIRKKPEITGEKSAAFQLMSERENPEELKEWMEQEKAHPFMLTYAVEQDIYAARSYGPQNKTGYQIKVDAVLEGEKTVRIQTSLLGPEKGEKTKDVVTYPYVVVKLKKTEKEILFE